jgi:hypothetical protein
MQFATTNSLKHKQSRNVLREEHLLLLGDVHGRLGSLGGFQVGSAK